MARSQLHQINSYLRPHYRDLALGTVALFIVNAVGTYIPWLIRTAIDQLSETFTTDKVMYFVVIISILASVMWVIRMASRMWLFGIGRSVEFDLRQKIFEHLLKLPPSYFSNNSAGNLISIATSDVENIRRLLGFAIVGIKSAIELDGDRALSVNAGFSSDVWRAVKRSAVKNSR
jgi:ATP-binding cassette, subfamily B, multidrug efflux pump